MENTSNTDLVPQTVSELKNLNITNLQAQEVGLNLLLLQLAQREAKRISKLAAVIDKLEDQIFDIDLVEHLSPAEQMQRYQLAMQATKDSSAYIGAAVKSVNWQDLETRIMILSQQSENLDTPESIQQGLESKDLQNAAMHLLKQLSGAKDK